jgi:long-subunit fatty acid transport protein
MPMQAIGGVWFAPYPELRIELDAALAQWSGTNNTYAYFPGGVAAANLTLEDRDWKDTLSLRLGVEGDITDAVMIYGGISLEPTPVPSSRLEPASRAATPRSTRSARATTSRTSASIWGGRCTP